MSGIKSFVGESVRLQDAFDREAVSLNQGRKHQNVKFEQVFQNGKVVRTYCLTRYVIIIFVKNIRRFCLCRILQNTLLVTKLISLPFFYFVENINNDICYI